jgi:hypothetical protein
VWRQQCGDARLVDLEGQRDAVAHEPHVLADVFGEAVGRAGHREHGPVAGPIFRGTGVRDPVFHFADAGQVLVKLGLVRVTDVPIESTGG